MLNEFSRTQLLLGKEAMDKLAKARVAVFGIGGVGGYVVEGLARSGVYNIDIIDDDKVCITNINRQIIAQINENQRMKNELEKNSSESAEDKRFKGSETIVFENVME